MIIVICTVGPAQQQRPSVQGGESLVESVLRKKQLPVPRRVKSLLSVARAEENMGFLFLREMSEVKVLERFCLTNSIKNG